MKKPYTIGLTGGIGAGKSTIAQIFKSIDIPVFNSDLYGKELLINNQNIRRTIIKTFGDHIEKNDIIDKKKLSQIVFSNKEKLEELNKIIHPKVKLEFESWLKQQTSHYIIKESALLFETNTEQMLDKIILVKAPLEIRIQRVCKRDNRTKKEVEKIIKNQIDPNSIIKKVDYLINNNEEKLLTPKIIKLHNILKKL